MMQPTRLAALALTFAASGCASVYDKSWYRAGASASQVQQDRITCQYETEKAMATYQPRTGLAFNAQQALSQGMLAGLDVAARKDRVNTLCMASKGYSLRERGVQDETIDRSIVSPRPSPAATPLPTAAATVAPTAAGPYTVPAGIEMPTPPPKEGPVVNSVGTWTFGAEKLARAAGCAPEPTARLTGKGPSIETFAVSCTNGDVMNVRCEYGQCRALR